MAYKACLKKNRLIYFLFSSLSQAIRFQLEPDRNLAIDLLQTKIYNFEAPCMN